MYRYSGKGCLIDVDLSNVDKKTFPVNVMASLAHISSHNPQKQHFPKSICGYVFGYFSLYFSGGSNISIALLGYILAHNPQDMHASISCVCSSLYFSGIGMASWGNLTVMGFENRFFNNRGIIKIFIITPIHCNELFTASKKVVSCSSSQDRIKDKHYQNCQ